MNMEKLKDAKQIRKILEDFPQLSFRNHHKHDRTIRNNISGEWWSVGVISRTRVERLIEACEAITLSDGALFAALNDLRRKERNLRGEINEAMKNDDWDELSVLSREMSNLSFRIEEALNALPREEPECKICGAECAPEELNNAGACETCVSKGFN